MKKNQILNYDTNLFLVIFALVALGTVVIYSASSPTGIDHTTFLLKHVFWLVIGFVLLIFFSFVNYKHLRKIAFSLMIISIVMLILGFILNTTTKPSRWLLYLDSGSKMITVSDIVKFSLIIFTAYYLEKVKNIGHFTDGLLPYLLLGFPAIGLILLQPDLSTSLVLTVIIFSVLFVGGAKISHIFMLGLSAIPFVAFYINKNPYQFKRITDALNRDLDKLGGNMQNSYSEIAISSGGFVGKGLGNSILKNGHLPEAHTDFVLAIISEELGFLIVALILSAFLYIFYKGIKIAKNAPDPFAMYLSLGIVISMMFYVIVHAGYVTGLLPTTGLPLPFMSYGGTHTIVTMASMGILLNISKAAFKNQVPHFGRVYGR
jgi:cell division protein FtsW